MGGGLALAAAVVDARTHRLPDRLTAPLAAVALVGLPLAAATSGGGLPVSDLGAGVAIFAGPWLAVRLASPASIGLGDVKLSAGLGLYLGWLGPMVAATGLVAAIAAGGVMVAGRALARHDRSNLPFGPALVAGAVLACALDLAP